MRYIPGGEPHLAERAPVSRSAHQDDHRGQDCAERQPDEQGQERIGIIAVNPGIVPKAAAKGASHLAS
jgi:hypothetical protein